MAGQVPVLGLCLPGFPLQLQVQGVPSSDYPEQLDHFLALFCNSLNLSVSTPERSTLQCKVLSEFISLGLFVYMQAETGDEILELMEKENSSFSSPLVASP